MRQTTTPQAVEAAAGQAASRSIFSMVMQLRKDEGSITSIQAVYVPADNLTDPAPATTFVHLDATTVLSRGLAAKGIYPAEDPLDSTLLRNTMKLRRGLFEVDKEFSRKVTG
ncbi:hypothetical protein RJ639_003101 [Escallonia herrerae]|uniref:H(+)-transporting two-sector ATPase n=1 Tax=Escallonia herrerae TaxID=1293975 RepID=A0AA88W218_9ASTE|nr:hypothetical protein RJ639_003101 [Escallonia herrerae]